MTVGFVPYCGENYDSFAKHKKYLEVRRKQDLEEDEQRHDHNMTKQCVEGIRKAKCLYAK